MTKVIFDMSMSLDGFVKASNATPEQPLGESGERLHQWGFSEDERDREVLAGGVEGSGEIIAGRRTYDSLPWWGADGPHPPTRVFVLTHQAPDAVPEGSVYTFVTDGIESALEQAKAAAGEKNVAVMGGPGPRWGPCRLQIIRGRFAVRGASLRSGAPCGAVAPQDRLSSVRR